MISSIPLFEVINVLASDLKNSLDILPSAADAAAAVKSNVVKTFVTDGLINFYTKGKGAFSNVPRSLPGSSPDCIDFSIILFSWWIICESLTQPWNLSIC